MTKCGIYKITNNINGKVYIGQSVNITRRWREHRTRYHQDSKDSINSHLYRAARKTEGWNNWTFEIIEECPEDQLNSREKFWIKYYDSSNPEKGYNETEGGDDAGTSWKLTTDQVNEIINLLKNTKKSQTEIADTYGSSQSMISSINTGEYWNKEEINYPIRSRDYMGRQHYYCPICGKEITSTAKYCKECSQKLERKVERPSREELKNEIRLNAFTQLGKKYGVTDNTIRKWCRRYDLPYRVKDISNYSDEEWKKI